MTDIADLIARVEAATGPDRALDAEIAVATRTGLPAGCDWALKFPKWEAGESSCVRIIGNVNGNGDYIAGRFNAPHYTASFDAAITLVPEGAGMQVHKYWIMKVDGPVWYGMVTIPSKDPKVVVGCDHIEAWDCRTAALAVVAAALKAIEAQQ